MKKVILFGAGGHSKVIQDIVELTKGTELYAVLDDSFNNKRNLNGVIYDNPSLLNELNMEDYSYCIAVGSNNVRKSLYKRFGIPLNQYITLIHPSAVISKSVVIGKGTVVMANAVINSDTTIGDHCIINSGAIVEHDNKIKNFVHISPNTTLAGTVKVGEGTHVGAGAVVIPSKTIGEWSTIGAGSVIIQDIEDEVTAVGVPGKIK